MRSKNLRGRKHILILSIIIVVFLIICFVISVLVNSDVQYEKIQFVYDDRLNKTDSVEAVYNGTLYFAYGIIPKHLLGKRFGTRDSRSDEIRKVKGYPVSEWFAAYEGGMLSPNPILYKAIGVNDTPLAKYKYYDYENLYRTLSE